MASAPPRVNERRGADEADVAAAGRGVRMSRVSERPSAVALLSGGLDSAVAAASAQAEGLLVHGLTVDYGQRCRAEIGAAAKLADRMGLVTHRVVGVDLRAVGGSSLTGSTAVPRDRSDAEMGQGVPNTYVPARNTVLLAVALGLAEVVGARTLVIGANALDYSGYPDCRGPFLRAFEELASLATAAGTEEGARFRVSAPLLEMSKAEIVLRGVELDVPLVLTVSCYVQEGLTACGKCDACALRTKGFREAGVVNPTVQDGGRL